MKESMVIYESAYLAINYLPTTELKWEAIEGLLKYGFYDIKPESKNPFVNMVYVQAIPSLKSASERYNRAVENGLKGGRPPKIDKQKVLELKEQGLSRKEIAEMLDISENSVKTILRREGSKGSNLSLSDPLSDPLSYSLSSSNGKEEVADAQKERNIEDLSDEEANKIIEKIRNKTPYIEIQKEHNLKYGSVTKDFEKQWKSIKSSRAYVLEQQAELERMKNEPQIDYNRLAKTPSKKETDISDIMNDIFSDNKEPDNDSLPDSLSIINKLNNNMEGEMW